VKDIVKVRRPKDHLKVRRPKDHLKVRRPTDHLKVRHPTDHLKVRRPKDHFKVKRPNDPLKVRRPKDPLKVRRPRDHFRENVVLFVKNVKKVLIDNLFFVLVSWLTAWKNINQMRDVVLNSSHQSLSAPRVPTCLLTGLTQL